MISKESGVVLEVKKPFPLRLRLALAGGLLALPLLFAGTQAAAQRAHFRYVGGRWSHASHSGWNRYWGGPSIGFYYAPTPVYLVSGYAAPSYYVGSSFWTSNPSFGISLNFGGSGYNGGGGNYRVNRSYGNSGHFSGGRPDGNGSHFSGGRPDGNSGHFSGGRPAGNSGRSSSGGGRSSGGGGRPAGNSGRSSGGGGRSSGGGRGRN